MNRHSGGAPMKDSCVWAFRVMRRGAEGGSQASAMDLISTSAGTSLGMNSID